MPILNFPRAAIVGTLAAALAPVIAAPAPPPAGATTVWFDQPATAFHQSCVTGNGRIGAMDMGGVDSERVILNESSVWSGGAYDGNKYDDGSLPVDAAGRTERRPTHTRARPPQREVARPLPGGAVFPVRPLPDGRRLAARLAPA